MFEDFVAPTITVAILAALYLWALFLDIFYRHRQRPMPHQQENEATTVRTEISSELRRRRSELA